MFACSKVPVDPPRELVAPSRQHRIYGQAQHIARRKTPRVKFRAL